MTCSEFESLWNSLLDQPSVAMQAARERLDAHALSCDRCSRRNAGFQLLAGQVWSPPAPSADLADRVFCEWKQAGPGVWSLVPLRRWTLPLAAAAACALVVILNRPWMANSEPIARPVAVVSAGDGSLRPLSMAFAEATSATLGLVREASEPAARVGQQIFRPSPVPIASLPATSGLLPTAGSLEAVGARVDSNVRVFSSTARRAFSFLGGAPSAETPAPAVKAGDA